MVRTKQATRRGKNNPNRKENAKDYEKNRKPGVVKIPDGLPKLAVESFLDQLSAMRMFDLSFRDFRSLYKDKVHCGEVPSEEHAIRMWEPAVELNKLKVKSLIAVPAPFQRKIQIGEKNLYCRGIVMSDEGGRVEVIAQDIETVVQAHTALIISKVFGEGVLARFLFENYLYRMYNLIKNKRDPIELFEVPENMEQLIKDADAAQEAEMEAKKLEKENRSRSVTKKGMVVTSIESFLRLQDEPKVEKPIQEEYLYEMKKPQEALLALGGNDCIESIKSRPIEGNEGLVDDRRVFVASMTLTGMETPFEAFASMDKYAIEACAASILSEVFEKPQLAAKLLDKFQSSFNASLPMLPVLFEDASTEETVPSDVLLCRDKGPCGLLDVLHASHGKSSTELSRDNMSRCLSPKEALGELILAPLDKFYFFKHRMDRRKVDVIGCVHKDVKRFTKHQAYSSSAYVALQGACANYLSLHIGDSELAREMLFRFDNTYCEPYKCYQRMKIKKFASHCHEFAINGLQFQSQIDEGEKIFQKCITNLNDSHFDTLSKMYKMQIMRMYVAGVLDDSADNYPSQPFQKKRRLDSCCTKPFIPKFDPLSDVNYLPELSNFTDLIGDPKLKALEFYMEMQNDKNFIVNLRVNDCFNFAALSENSAEHAMFIACKKAQVGLNSENFVKEIQNDLAAMLSLLTEDYQVSIEELKVDVQYLEEYERFEAALWFRGQSFKAFSDLNKSDALREAVAQCLKFANSQN